MPRRVIAVLAGALVVAIPTAGVGAKAPNEAIGSTGDQRACTTEVDGDTVTVECRDAPPAPVRPIGVVSAPQPCRWVPATAAHGWDPAAYGDISQSGYEFFEGANAQVGRRFPDGREEMVFERVCLDGSGFTWVDVTVTVQDAIDDAVDRARRAAPSPTLDMNPPPDVGGIVNLGLWLALAGQDPVTVRAEAGSLWAEATVTLASTSWDMGNGDVVTCDGPGTPIVDTDTLEQGPCGYTYRQSSPDDAPYTMTVTARWNVSYRSSAGSGSVGGVDRSLSVDYDVDEIQTV